MSLTPRSFPKDGNTLYVLLSTVVFDTHDNHANVRHKIWNLFCEKTVGQSIDAVLAVAGDPSTLTFKDACRDEEWFEAWIGTFDPRRGRVDLTDSRYAAALITMVQTHSMNHVDAPAMELVAPLVVELFGIVLVLYVGGKEKYLKQEPDRIWYPPGYASSVRNGQRQTYSTMVKHVHLLRDTHCGIQLLVRPNPLARPIPTRVVGHLNLKEREEDGEEGKRPWESDLVKKHAVYSLGVYDSARRKHYQIGHFIAPETGRNPDAKLTHFINLDARFALSDTLVFVIGGCQATTHPIYIFATKTLRGQRQAIPIGHWPVDYTDPRIGLEKTDDGIIIVPAGDRVTAYQTLIAECKCQVLEHR